ncbi:ATP-dependent DNA helicase PIF3 [Cladobotryum mycophilum]|uniref:ATP-dependent DNA helicase n=1 Tax=Cladobotryum mycophilum TaxID=491253 RepID=A0ABR0S836_9HYPO
MCILPSSRNKRFPCVGFGLRHGQITPIFKTEKMAKQYAAKQALAYLNGLLPSLTSSTFPAGSSTSNISAESMPSLGVKGPAPSGNNRNARLLPILSSPNSTRASSSGEYLKESSNVDFAARDSFLTHRLNFAHESTTDNIYSRWNHRPDFNSSEKSREIHRERYTPLDPLLSLPPRCEELKLSADQERVVALATMGQNIFYTGSAGCGKSTVLHVIHKHLLDLGKKVYVMAPTGRVAIANGGTTTWAFAGWTPNSHKRPLSELKQVRKAHVRRRLRAADTIIPDEISMVENLHFERLNEVMKAARTSLLPFGGAQVITTGDFCTSPDTYLLGPSGTSDFQMSIDSTKPYNTD